LPFFRLRHIFAYPTIGSMATFHSHIRSQRKKKEATSGLKNVPSVSGDTRCLHHPKMTEGASSSIPKRLSIINHLKSLLFLNSCQEDHTLPNTFIRKRKLPFLSVFILLLQKSVKSLQLLLNEFMTQIGETHLTVTNSAFSQARKKFLYTTFIELSQQGIVRPFYGDGDYKTYRGFRLLAIDGSKIILPNEPAIGKAFGSIPFRNEKMAGSYAAGHASVCYDILNFLALDSMLAPANAYEVNLAIEHLDHVGLLDLLLFDRGYISYRFLATLIARNNHFIGRCSRKSFGAAQELFEKDIPSKIVTIKPNHKIIKEIKALGLPKAITVRFVRVVLDNGEVEVLVTSLLDEQAFTPQDFKYLYGLRWGIETYYGLIKERLRLENFTGKTVEAVTQDFYATIFVTNLESVLTREVQQELDKKDDQNRYNQKVNKVVSFNAIKNNAIELLLRERNTPRLLAKLDLLFRTNPTLARPGRHFPRKRSFPRKVLDFVKRRRKECY
jgi:hypothetical protein